jgi:hypothetical protein
MPAGLTLVAATLCCVHKVFRSSDTSGLTASSQLGLAGGLDLECRAVARHVHTFGRSTPSQCTVLCNSKAFLTFNAEPTAAAAASKGAEFGCCCVSVTACRLL